MTRLDARAADAPTTRIAAIARELAWFVAVGAACTVLFLALYNALRSELEPFAANGVAVALSMVVSFVLNRRLTFRRRGRVRWAGQLFEFTLVFGVTLGGSSIALAVLFATVPSASRIAENLALLVSTALTFVLRFALLRAWVFKSGR